MTKKWDAPIPCHDFVMDWNVTNALVMLIPVVESRQQNHVFLHPIKIENNWIRKKRDGYLTGHFFVTHLFVIILKRARDGKATAGTGTQCVRAQTRRTNCPRISRLNAVDTAE